MCCGAPRRALGYEIIPTLITLARSVSRKAGFGSGGRDDSDSDSDSGAEEEDDANGTGVAYFRRDMLAAPLEAAGTVVLASQLWDAALLAKARARLAAGLPSGAVVVDYCPGMNAAHPEAFEDAGELRIATSWTDAHPIFLSRRR